MLCISKNVHFNDAKFKFKPIEYIFIFRHIVYIAIEQCRTVQKQKTKKKTTN